MHHDNIDSDEGEAQETTNSDTPEKKKRKRVTKPNVAKSRVFGGEASTRTFSIAVKLAPRCLNVDIEKKLRNCAEVISERAIWASRLANFVAEHSPDDFATAFEQSNGQTFYGQLLSTMAGIKRNNPKATLLPKHIEKFRRTIPNFDEECPRLLQNDIKCNIQNPMRNQMAKDAVKHLKDRMRDKLPLFIRHGLRKILCQNSVHLNEHLRSGEVKKLIYLVSKAIMLSACALDCNDTSSISKQIDVFLEKTLKSRNESNGKEGPELTSVLQIVPNTIISQLLEACHVVHADVRAMLVPLIKAGGELKRIAEEKAKEKKEKEEQERKANPPKKPKHDKDVSADANSTKKPKRKRQATSQSTKGTKSSKTPQTPQTATDKKPSLPIAMWVWCTSNVKYLGMVLPVLKTIRDVFVADAEPRDQILRDTQGRQNKAARRENLKALQSWQCEVPDAFDLLPQKPRAVNFVSVSKSVASSIFKEQIGGVEDDTFWWKGILKFDDDRDFVWKRIVDADAFLDRADLVRIVQHDSPFATTKQFRRNRVGKGNSGSKTKRRSKPSRIPSLATSPMHLEALRKLQIPPLILGGFKTNGYELHLEVMTANDPESDEPHRERIEGFDFLQNKGFDSLRGDTGDEIPIDGGSYGKGSIWDRKDTKGVYGSIVKPTNIQASDESRFCVVDPGQINPLTLRAFSIKDGFECASPNDAQLIVTEAEYHRDVGSVDNKLWESATKQQPNLKVAMDCLSQPTRTLEERDVKLANEAKHWKALWSERTNLKYDRNRMQRRCCRDGYTVKVYKWMRDQGCTAVWFGTGACKARGHRPVPTKSMMRGLGRYIPVVAGNEWGTSSRCPSCKDGTKLKRVIDQEGSKSPTTHSLEVDSTDVQVEDMLATQPESHSKHLPSSPLATPRPVKPTHEHRCETCIKCKKTWGHDEVATINQKMRFCGLLLGGKRTPNG